MPCKIADYFAFKAFPFKTRHLIETATTANDSLLEIDDPEDDCGNCGHRQDGCA